MKRYILLFSGLMPGAALATSTGMLLAGLGNIPEDFKTYFFQSELPVQVYLNDKPLFGASMKMREDGGIILSSVMTHEDALSPQVQEQWESILRKGITTGRCEANCPQGLISADYSLDNSTLRLLTSHYEKERVQGDYIDLPDQFPAGIIINNDFSALQSSFSDKRMSLNSEWTASLAGWSHNMAFQSTHVAGKYGYDMSDLYNLYSQKERAGNFIRLGFFTPDSDSGNVQTSSFGYDTIIGAMWGTSDILLQNSESVSAWPVYVSGRNQSVAEVWRDGRLLHTQQLQDGIQALDTRRLPGGIYDISIRILENGQVVDTQTAQIYKPNSWRDTSRHWRANIWAGQQQKVSSRQYDDEQNGHTALGGSLDVLAWTGGILGVSASALDNDDHWLRLRSDITLSNSDSLFLQHTRTSSGLRDYAGTDARYYRSMSSELSGSLYWRNTRTEAREWKPETHQSDTWGGSLSAHLGNGARLTARVEYRDSPWQRGVDADVSLTTRHRWYGRDADVRISGYDRNGFSGESRDRGAAINLTMALFPSDSRHTVSAAVGVDDGHAYTNASYQWAPDKGNTISWLGAGISHSGSSSTFSGNGAVDTRYVNADGFIQHTTSVNNTTAGINLNQTLAVGEWKAATSRNLNGHDAVMIVDVEDEHGTGVVASGSLSDTKLSAGRNVIPVNLWKRDTVQFTSDDHSASVTPERISFQMNSGSVGYVKVKSVQMQTLIAVLRDSNGKTIPDSAVTAGDEKGFVNNEGILTMSIAANTRTLKASRGTRKLTCTLPQNISAKEEILYLNDVSCK
ncbi:TcfC E-set like domain-containing protein [Enterobacteriaceae bacterium C23F]